MLRSTLGAVVGVLCLWVTAGAQAAQGPAVPPAASVPRLVRVDGQFVPASGLPPAAMEVVTLALYASDSDATPVWEETQEVRVDAQGRYAVFLGATSVEGLPVAMFAAGDPRWLGMRFARPGETEQPRVLLTSVPYALRAADADTLGGLPPSAFLRAAGDARADNAAGSAGGATTADRTPTPNVSTGTANYLGKFTNAVDLTSSVLFENNGRIGLNTTTPLDFMHSRFTDNFGALTGLAVQNLGSSTSSYSGMLFYDHTGALRQFQGYNNSTGEYRINNISPTGSINFMLGGTSRFLVRPDGDIEIPGNLYKGQFMFLKAAGGGSVHSIGLGETALTNVGIGNVAVGGQAIGGPTSGGTGNVGIGQAALYSSTGIGNVGVGTSALSSSTGNYTVALGYQAGSGKFGANDYNIYIGAAVGASGATETGTVRIGDNANYSRFYAGGIRGITTGSPGAVNVVIDSQGQLGTISSSRRFKTDIEDMAGASSGLMRLRPVTYRYKKPYADGSMPLDYGLIAEEVAEVYPDLVTHASDGQVETVQYHKVNAMLLNEVQKQQRELADVKARLAALEMLLTSRPH